MIVVNWAKNITKVQVADFDNRTLPTRCRISRPERTINQNQPDGATIKPANVRTRIALTANLSLPIWYHSRKARCKCHDRPSFSKCIPQSFTTINRGYCIHRRANLTRGEPYIAVRCQVSQATRPREYWLESRVTTIEPWQQFSTSTKCGNWWDGAPYTNMCLLIRRGMH